jgi:pimeloyl-ACP methyl ester carboxylesterase
VAESLGGLAAEGRLTDAAHALAGFPLTEADIAVTEDAGYFRAAGRYVRSTPRFFRQLTEYEGPTPDDPAVRRAVSARALVLHGSDAKPYATRSARHVADHVPNARTHEIPGAGHAVPLTHPEALAEALVEFFSPAQQSA